MRITDHKNSSWAEQLKDSPFESSQFTEELKDRIRENVGKKRRGRLGDKRVLAALVLGAAVAVLLLVIIRPIGLSPAALDSHKARASYMSSGKLLFEVIPGGNLTAGQPAGMIVSFKEPFDAYRDKTLSIQAVHLTSGYEVTLVSGDRITEPSSGYSSLERYTVPSAGLPLSGNWRIAVKWEGELYGDAVLEVREPAWEVSPTFPSMEYTLRGVEGRLGLLDSGFVAGDTNKYMWSLWGTEEELSGTFRAIAVKQGGEQWVELFTHQLTASSSHYADRYFPSSLSLPEPGLWRITAYVDDRLFGSIVVEAQEKDKVLSR